LAEKFDLVIGMSLPTKQKEEFDFIEYLKIFKDQQPDCKILGTKLIPKEEDIQYKGLIDCWVSLVDSYPTAEKKFNEFGFTFIYIPLAADEHIFYPLFLNKRADVSFIGTLNHSENRHPKEYLYDVIDANRFTYILCGFPYKDLKFIPNVGIAHSVLNKIYNEVRVNLNFHYDSQKGEIDDRLDFNARTFEVALSGNFQICDHPLLKKYFGDAIPNIGREEWLDAIEYYKNNETERNTMASKAREIVLKNHTWKIRMSQFLQQLKEKGIL
jgi:spore maturation protein CgeB